MVKVLMILISILFLSITSGPLYGQEKHPIDRKWEEAIDRDMSTAGMKKAGNMALDEWTQEMNKYYNLLMTELGEKERVALEKAQRDWEAYRKAEVNFIQELYGIMHGSFFAVSKIEKHAEIVRKRALELQFNYDLLMDEKPYDYYR